MDWSDEHYVKLYTRDTLTWRSWCFETRTLFLHLVRKVNGSGFIEVGTMDPAAALALQLEMPVDFVSAGLPQLLACGTAELVDRALLLVKFNEAQEARKSDAQRKRDERARTIIRRRSAQPIEILKQHVTRSHTESQPVTQKDPPSPAQPSPAQPVPSPASAASQLSPPIKNDWDGPEDFWNWFQSLRRKAGCVREKPPNPRALSAFWAEALGELEGNPEPLREAVFRFGDDKFWQAKDPPCPFAGFASVWSKYVPRGALAHDA